MRANDRVQLVEAYVELADSLFRGGEPEKARVVYSRVLELSPVNGRARFALGLISDDTAAEPSSATSSSDPMPPVPPSPSDMVSMFDLALRRTPVDQATSISAELPIITDGFFSAAADRRDAQVDSAAADLVEESVDVGEVLAFERDLTDAAAARDSAAGSSNDAHANDAHANDAHANDAHANDAHASDAHASDAHASDTHASDSQESDAQVDGWAAGLPIADAPIAGEASGPDAADDRDDAKLRAGHGGNVGAPVDRDDNRPSTNAAAAEHDERAADSVPPSLTGEYEIVDVGEVAPAASDADDSLVAPFPAPSLDEQINAAFAEPPIVEADVRLAHDGAVDVGERRDGSDTPPLGAAAFATPFSSLANDATALTPTGLPGLVNSSDTTATTLPAPGPIMTSGDTPVPDVRPESDAAIDGSRDGSRDERRDDSEEYVDLSSWLLDDEPVRSTRMVTAEATPSGDEQADFDEMLRRFKQGVAANVDEEDYASHYDLGVAYKEMGLIDEAIAEFQKSLRGDDHRVRSYEALGQCFVEKGQLQVAGTLLQRAVETSGADDQQLVGVLYLLGYASEVLARHADALRYYQRVFAVDIEFRDVAQRVAAMEQRTQ
ncbi:MAG: tetratricopeptide repeat protein [Gemmatimonadetes bacterium]|nr:tetratricopeptide repeat protein [Gemmatimonadota bacterium]